jgi:hypothetical protein
VTGAHPGGGAVMRATSLRVMGATIRTVGKATAQAKAQEDIHVPKNSGGSPMARTVAMAETMQDMSPDRMKPKRTGAKRAGIMLGSGVWFAPFIAAWRAMVNGTKRARPARC